MMRVLFVDDEENILNGLRRMLRPQSKDWEMHFVTSGEAALQAMAEEPFHVVISDMKMPGMDGVALLSQIKRDYPDTIRVVLSGQSSRGEVLRAVSPAHQYIAKPCESDHLLGTIAQAIELRSVLSAPRVTGLVSRVETLPVLPDLYASLTEELNRPEPRVDELSRIIEGDPAMTANILKLVNSAFFGLRREVSQVRQAISFLGTDTISVLVLSEGIFRQFDPAAFKAFSLDTVSAHSSRTARAALDIAKAEQAEPSVGQHAFTAGMLHNVGKLVLASDFPNEYGKDGGDGAAGGFEQWQGEIGAYLLGLWGLPDPIVEAVAFSAKPSEFGAKGAKTLTFVHVASALTAPGRAEAIKGEEGENAGLDMAYLEREGVLDRLEAWKELIGVDDGTEAAA